MKTFRITTLVGSFDTSVCPPPIVKAVFPGFDGWAVYLQPGECLVDVPDGHQPVDLGPLVKVEPLS